LANRTCWEGSKLYDLKKHITVILIAEVRKLCGKGPMSNLETVLSILVMNMIYVSLAAVRMILVMKARRFLASFISLFGVFVYLMALTIVQ
jgi:hypothetical protein